MTSDSGFTTVTYIPPGYFELRTKELEERLKLAQFFAWGNLIGWVLTIVIYEVLK